MDEIKIKAKELLEAGNIKVVIGYGEGTAGRTRAVFIRKPEDATKLIYNERCVNNLAFYLLKHEVKHFGKMAIVATIPVMRSILQMASENQLKDGAITILAITPDGKLTVTENFKDIEEIVKSNNHSLTTDEQERIKKIQSMSMEERWDFWNKEFSKCFKCYACRQACPLCFCVRCNVENNNPQWIPVPAHQLGNLEWHIMRAMHLAGRCINCGECAKGCPADIPLNLLTYTLINDVKDEFGYVAGMSATQESALSSYKTDDKENFIL